MLPQAGHHPRSGLIYALDGHAQRCGNFAWSFAVEYHLDKRLPDAVPKLGADSLQQPGHNVAVVLFLPGPTQVAGGIGELLEKVFVDRLGRHRVTGPPIVQDAVAEDGAKPAAKTAFAGVVFEVWHLASYGHQDLLHHIGRVLRWYGSTTHPGGEKRGVKCHEAGPGGMVARIADPQKEAGGCFGHAWASI